MAPPYTITLINNTAYTFTPIVWAGILPQNYSATSPTSTPSTTKTYVATSDSNRIWFTITGGSPDYSTTVDLSLVANSNGTVNVAFVSELNHSNPLPSTVAIGVSKSGYTITLGTGTSNTGVNLRRTVRDVQEIAQEEAAVALIRAKRFRA
ncbi:hypothetical protein H072_2646 [Dactylellina haptotyla CBS 200.50]|uniref:Uncharacterized protein n=1 Tax=Dactylellina haptotyla (strain CBS 200.50) TaxID=1284197 RepID=S8BV90_DACHA|nr:hypothetical protein H072_2646 [Dactylellina haptotyla CBS 200.50]